MIQHTQTHKATRSKSPSSTISSTSSLSSASSVTSISSSSSSTYEPENTPEFLIQQQNNHLQTDSSDEESSITLPESKPLLKELHLTQDEFEALQGFGRFKHTPIFIDSFRDLASVVYIEPNPVRNYIFPPTSTTPTSNTITTNTTVNNTS